MESILSVKNLSFAYGAKPAIADVSLDIDKGHFVALVGPNGAGKSTLIKVILGLEKNYTGEIKLFGEELGSFSAWNRIGYLPQRVNVFNPLFPATVREVVGLGLLAGKRYPKRFDQSHRKKIDELLSFLGVSELGDRPITELSGGQQQRVFLARALVSDPELLIMDEPSTALDPGTRDIFFGLVRKLNREKQTTVIMITHDTAQIGEYADKLIYLDKSVIFYGDFSAFCHSAEMEKYFGYFSQHLICHQH